jgi:lysozyme
VNRAKPAAFGVSIIVAGVALVAASPRLRQHLEDWESSGDRVLVVYADKLANNLPTVCNGITRHVTATPIIVGERWTTEKCVAEETEAIVQVQHDLAFCFQRPPPQQVFDMATEHAWNFGVSATCGSGSMAAWNRGEWELGCRRMAQSDSGKPVWSYVCGGSGSARSCRFVQGLANRRAAAREVCLRPDFSNVIGGT